MKMLFRLVGTEHYHPITKQTDPYFFQLIQHTALLGLKEEGYLTQMQYQYAAEALRRQYQKEAGTSNEHD